MFFAFKKKNIYFFKKKLLFIQLSDVLSRGVVVIVITRLKIVLVSGGLPRNEHIVSPSTSTLSSV